MQHRVLHGLDRELARQGVDAAIRNYVAAFAKYDPQASWRDDWTAVVSFRAGGMSFSGEVFVGPDAIELDLDVPLAVRPLKAKALAVIEQEIAGWVARVKAGELPDA